MKYIVITLALFFAAILGLTAKYHNNQMQKMTELQDIMKSLPKTSDVVHNRSGASNSLDKQ